MVDLWIPPDPHDAIVDDYSDAKIERKPHGIIIVDGKEVGHTLKCPHCGGQFLSRKGSGHRRSFCLVHKAVTCGSDACVRDCVDVYALEGTLSVREYEMSQHARPVGPTTVNAQATFTPSMVQGCGPDYAADRFTRSRFSARAGWQVSQTTPVSVVADVGHTLRIVGLDVVVSAHAGLDESV